MRSFKSLVIFIFNILILFFAPLSGFVQAQTNPTPAELVTQYLNQDIFLIPGTGLKKVSIGSDFTEVLNVWGKPNRTKPDGLTENVWVYEVAEHTEVILRGNIAVGSIEITGNVNSPFSTQEGAKIGMPVHQIAGIYGPTKLESNRMTYSAIGIGFQFNQGQVISMRVFKPK